MSPAQTQLALSLVERMAHQMHEEYMQLTTRASELFNELAHVNHLVDVLRVEVARVGGDGAIPPEPALPAGEF